MKNFDVQDTFPNDKRVKYLDFKQYAYDVTFTKFTPEEVEYNAEANYYMTKNKNRDRCARIRFTPVRVKTDFIAMLAPPSSGLGYLRGSDEKYLKFIKDVHDTLYTKVPDDAKDHVSMMLVNQSMPIPYIPMIIPSFTNKVDKKYHDIRAMKMAARAYDDLLFSRLYEEDPINCTAKAKKTSSIGYPFETVDGTPISNMDLVSHLESEPVDVYSKMRLRKDTSQVKLSWLRDQNGCKAILREQLQIAKDQHGNLQARQIPALMEHPVITVVNPAFRKNSLKPCANDDGVFDFRKPYAVRGDTPFDIITKDGVTNGMIDQLKLSKVLKEEFPEKAGYPARWRYIYPASTVSHICGTIFATTILHKAETGKRGNPSVRPEVVADHRYFYNKYSRTHKMIVLGFDAKQSEKTYTTNAELFANLWPERWHNYRRVTSTSVQPTQDGYYVTKDALNSGIWDTTLVNILKGNYESCRCALHDLAFSGYRVKSLYEVIYDFLRLIFRPESIEDVDFGSDIHANTKLGLDDTFVQIAIPLPLWDKIGFKFDEQMYKATLMSHDEDIEKLNMFGCDITPDDIVQATSNQLSKAITSEHMGFTLKDGFSTYIRMSTSGYDDVFDYYLNKHFSYGLHDYARFEVEFMHWLAAHGIPIEDVYNWYSPAERLVYGKYVSTELFGNSTRYPLEDVTDVLNIFKQYDKATR